MSPETRTAAVETVAGLLRSHMPPAMAKQFAREIFDTLGTSFDFVPRVDHADGILREITGATDDVIAAEFDAVSEEHAWRSTAFLEQLTAERCGVPRAQVVAALARVHTERKK